MLMTSIKNLGPFSLGREIYFCQSLNDRNMIATYREFKGTFQFSLITARLFEVFSFVLLLIIDVSLLN